VLDEPSVIFSCVLQVGCLPVLISAAVALAEEESLVSSGALNSTSELAIATRGVSGFVIAAAVITVVVLIVFIVLRVCNIGALNLVIKVFLAIVSGGEGRGVEGSEVECLLLYC